MSVERKSHLFSILIVVLLVLNLIDRTNNNGAVANETIVDQLVLKDKDGIIRYRVYIDEYQGVREEISDKYGNTRISRGVSNSGSSSVRYGTHDQGIEMFVMLEKKRNSSTAKFTNTDDSSYSVFDSSISLSSNNGDMALLSSHKDKGSSLILEKNSAPTLYMATNSDKAAYYAL